MKTFRKPISILLTALMLLACVPVFAFAAGDVTVKLRIEGLDACMYYGDVTVDTGASVYDVLMKADEKSDDLTVEASVSDYGAYISSINGLAAGSKTDKGWDGWQYHVNDADPQIGADRCIVKAGDSIVFFYSDEFGDIGFGYPEITVKDGKVSLTRTVTTYDENWNTVYVNEAVPAYTLTWGYGKGDTKTFIADENGVCEIPAYYYTNGEHSVQVEKTAENGLPLILRYAPDFTVTVEDADMSFFARFIAFFQMVFAAIRDFFAGLAK